MTQTRCPCGDITITGPSPICVGDRAAPEDIEDDESRRHTSLGSCPAPGHRRPPPRAHRRAVKTRSRIGGGSGDDNEEVTTEDLSGLRLRLAELDVKDDEELQENSVPVEPERPPWWRLYRPSCCRARRREGGSDADVRTLRMTPSGASTSDAADASSSVDTPVILGPRGIPLMGHASGGKVRGRRGGHQG